MRTRGLLTELLGRPGHDGLWRRILGWVIRARAELTVITLAVTVHLVLVAQTSWSDSIALAIESLTLGLVMVVPASRRYALHRMWAVCSRHRIGSCLVATRAMTPDGKLPLLAWARPSSIGERVHVWLPAGLSVNDLAQITEALAAACYAAEARVQVNRRWTHLAVITIVRRDPFTGKRLIRPRHTAGVPTSGRDEVFVPLPDRESVHMPTTTPGQPAGPTPGRGRRNGTAKPTRPAATTPTTTATTEDAAPTVVGVGGMDVSDYV